MFQYPKKFSNKVKQHKYKFHFIYNKAGIFNLFSIFMEIYL